MSPRRPAPDREVLCPECAVPVDRVERTDVFLCCLCGWQGPRTEAEEAQLEREHSEKAPSAPVVPWRPA